MLSILVLFILFFYGNSLNVPLQKYDKDMHANNGYLPTNRLLEVSWRFFNSPQQNNTDGNTLNNQINMFYARFTPYFDYISGNKYLIVICSWLLDSIMEWTGDPSQTYPINNLDAPQWSAPNATYKDVEIFFQSLRQNAKYYKQYENLKIGMAVIGWNNIYNVQNGPFQK
eukprot:335126_1